MKACTRLPQLLALLATLLAQSVLAQERGDFPGDRFRLSLSRSGLIDVEWARPAPHLSWDTGLALNFSQNHLVLYQISDNRRLGSLIGSRLGGSLFGTVGLWGWLEAGLEVPFILIQTREPQIMGGTVTSLAGLQGGLGDLRIQPKVHILNQEDVGIDVALMPSLTFPTGGQSNYRGEPSVTFQPELIAARTFGHFRGALNLGGVVRRQVTFINDVVGSDVTGRLGLGYRFQDDRGEGMPLEIDASLFAFAGTSATVFTAAQRGLELRVMGAYTFADALQILAGAGVGVLSGWSVPDYRVWLGIRYGQWDDRRGPKDTDRDGVVDPDDVCRELKGLAENKGCPDIDSDKDGIVDRLDRCLDKPGVADAQGCPDPDSDHDGLVDRLDKCPKEAGLGELAGCPDTDQDADGIADRADRCPTEREDADGFKDDDGCPDPDNDEDGVTDELDGCQMEKGVVENKGCPDTDQDGDSVVDRLDNCPNEAGTAQFQGCKTKQFVVITKEKLEIIAPIFFRTGSDVIDSKSFVVLDNVANVLSAHTEVQKVRIEGHTDNQGDPQKNLDLSSRRAESVKKYLMGKGISEGRLVARGFGDSQPIDDNKTKAGREKNRRVVFAIE